MSVYIVASIAVKDWAEYGKYQDGFLDAKYKGELLAVDGDCTGGAAQRVDALDRDSAETIAAASRGVAVARRS